MHKTANISYAVHMEQGSTLPRRDLHGATRESAYVSRTRILPSTLRESTSKGGSSRFYVDLKITHVAQELTGMTQSTFDNTSLYPLCHCGAFSQEKKHKQHTSHAPLSVAISTPLPRAGDISPGRPSKPHRRCTPYGQWHLKHHIHFDCGRPSGNLVAAFCYYGNIERRTNQAVATTRTPTTTTTTDT